MQKKDKITAYQIPNYTTKKKRKKEIMITEPTFTCEIFPPLTLNDVISEMVKEAKNGKDNK